MMDKKRKPRLIDGARTKRKQEMKNTLNTLLLYHESPYKSTDSWHKPDGELDIEAVRRDLQSMTDDELREARTFLLAMKSIIEADERNQHHRRGRRKN